MFNSLRTPPTTDTANSGSAASDADTGDGMNIDSSIVPHDDGDDDFEDTDETDQQDFAYAQRDLLRNPYAATCTASYCCLNIF